MIIINVYQYVVIHILVSNCLTISVMYIVIYFLRTGHLQSAFYTCIFNVNDAAGFQSSQVGLFTDKTHTIIPELDCTAPLCPPLYCVLFHASSRSMHHRYKAQNQTEGHASTKRAIYPLHHSACL